ncbi:MAG: hypothetical protein P1P83_07080 [Bacteroidales bacterium]|nr:hypothetical protein [Bacteroidales bacterium]MDT8373846.1 hypothetical protein [Bacteroidales bacterium]
MKLLFFLHNKANLIISLSLIPALAFITVLTSGHKVNIQAGSIPDAITEYRTFYEEQIRNTETKDHSMIPLRSPQWEKATIQKWYRGHAAVTPLDYEENYFISCSTSPYSFTLGAISFLMVNKGADGSMQGEIVYIIRDRLDIPSVKGGQSPFSGTILVESLHCEFLAAYVCQPDGSVLHYIDSAALPSPQMSVSEDLDCYIYELWQKTDIDGGETLSNPIRISSHTECCFIQESYSKTVAYNYYDLGERGDVTPPPSRPLSADELKMLESVRGFLSKD